MSKVRRKQTLTRPINEATDHIRQASDRSLALRLQCSYNITWISTLPSNGMMPTSLTLLAIRFLQGRPSRSLRTIRSTLRQRPWTAKNAPRALAAQIAAFPVPKALTDFYFTQKGA